MCILKNLKAVLLLLWSSSLLAAPDATQLAVWANEAIVATYTYDYKNYLPQQRNIAKYFTAPGWTAYSTALNASGLPAVVEKNAYAVSAVTTMPPEVKAISDNQWQATMPLLVIYKNLQYQQKQTLQVTINFSEAPAGQGIRGLTINNLQAKVSQPPCECQQPLPDTNPKNDAQQSPNAAPEKTVQGQ